ncbi:MAG: hypothetical protein AB7S26_06950 [Sandaracinaceae bacterium]
MGTRRALWVLAWLAAGCVGTAVPQPPNLEPIDPDLIIGLQSETTGGPLSMTGQPGAAAPNADLYIWDLGSPTPPTITPTLPDGSFSISIPGPLGALRLQARTMEDRSDPIDVATGSEGSLPVARPACARLDRELLLGERDSAVLAFVNDCATEVRVSEPRSRAGVPFVIEGAPTEPLAPGARAEMTVEAPSDRPSEDILLFEVTVDRTTYLYAITVGAGP